MNRLENAALQQRLYNGQSHWLGGITLGLKMQWYWIEGASHKLEPIVYRNWAPNDPNGGYMNTVILARAQQGGMWEDAVAGVTRPVICQWRC